MYQLVSFPYDLKDQFIVESSQSSFEEGDLFST